ncbi:MAG: hypothetical protein M3Z97_01195 [Candidatus Dormibacteraeota bacterium]|jgi:hypothetical protein|nr:hypothetical protein [Candidatus Dormibacteraeota bacterium]
MPTADEVRNLAGREIVLRTVPEAGGETVEGRLVGTLEAADGLVVVIERDGSSGRRFTCNYQHIAVLEERD